MLSNGHAKLPNGIYNNGHSQILKPHQNGNGFISSNGSLKGVFANGNGVYVDGSC
jgi:CTP synthase